MLQNGLIPSAAIPAENVTECSSSIPTSKKRSGIAFSKMCIPQPVDIAGVTPTTLLSILANSRSTSPKTSWYLSALYLLAALSPVSGLNRPGACQVVGSASAGAYPLPLMVMVCRILGPWRSLSLFKALITCDISLPSIGPNYLNPKDSKRSPPEFRTNMDLSLVTMLCMLALNLPSPINSQILFLSLLYVGSVVMFNKFSCRAPIF